MPSQDFIAGFDPTGQATITSANLLVLIQAGTPYTDKGLVVVTSDVAAVPVVPDAATITKLQRYIWVRKLATSVIAYVWNDAAASGALLKWQSITVSAIAPGSITNIMLAPGSVTDDKIVSVSWSKITGAPSFMVDGDAAGGDLTGTYPNPVVGNNKIDSSKLSSSASVDADRAVTNDHIKDGVIDPIAKLDSTPASALAILRTKAASDGWEYKKQPVLQSIVTNVANAHAAAAAGSVMALTTGLPQITEGVQLVTVNITPLSATSYIRCKFRGFFNSKPAGGNTPKMILALFKTGTASALQATAFEGDVAGAQESHELSIEWYIITGGTAAQTYSLRFGVANAADEGWFSINSAGNWFGGLVKSQFIVEEVQPDTFTP